MKAVKKINLRPPQKQKPPGIQTKMHPRPEIERNIQHLKLSEKVPVWTPLITSIFSPKKIETFGSDVPMQRAGEPAEVASYFVFLASADSSYMIGQIFHPNREEIENA